MSVRTGADIFHERWPDALSGAGIGLLVHPASVNSSLLHTADLFANSSSFQLKSFFGPQHGIYGETQDNMVEWKGFTDPKSSLPVHSLYSRTRKPEPWMLEDIDVMVIDLQDVGSRYYTFIWTVDLCMEACHDAGKSVVILDRPNPLGGKVIEGPLLDTAYTSFVGRRPLPVRHGMTIGEIGNYLKSEFHTSLDLHIIAMDEWQRDYYFDNTGLPWVLPSPNMPTLDAAIVYPGICLLEGTNLSEGRGTTRPFEIIGAPFVDPEELLKEVREHNLPGVVFRPMYFQPAFQKYAGEDCGGIQIHVIDREVFRPFKTGVALLKSIHDLYPDAFRWKSPPYEYEMEKMPIDILAGTDRLRKEIESREHLDRMESWWSEESLTFDLEQRKRFLIYE